MVKNHALTLTVNIFITYEEISYSCEDRGIHYSEMFLLVVSM